MDDNMIAFAVKQFEKRQYERDYTYHEFLKDIREHNQRRPNEPFSQYRYINESYARALWNVLIMDMDEIVERSRLNVAKFARRFCIPFGTMQTWCEGRKECPVYIKLMICEIMGLLPRRGRYISTFGEILY